MAQAIYNDAVLHQAQVAVAAHGLKVQLLFTQLTQVVIGADVDAQQAVAMQLADTQHPAGNQVLAHQHAKHRRLGQAFIGLVGQVQAGAGGVGVDEQAVVLPARADGQHHHILLGLLHAVHAAARQLVVEFPGDKAQRQAVQCHARLLVFNHRL